MQVAMEELDKLERKIHVTVPATEMTAINNEKLANLAHRVKIDGFRPGKIPLSVVRQRFGHDIWQEVIEETLRKTFISALNQYQFNVVGSPQFNPISMEMGKDFIYEVTFEIQPEIPEITLDTLSFKYFQANIEETDILQTLEDLRMQHRTWEPVKRDSMIGDKLTISFEGKINGEAFSGNKASEVEVELGKETLLPSFEHALVGMRAGENKAVHIHFPVDYHPELADKTALFNIKVHKVEIGQLPELTNDFVKTFGFESIDLLKEDIKKQLEHDAKKHAFYLFKNDFLDKVVAAYSIDLPKLMVEEEKYNIQAQSKEQETLSEVEVNQLAEKKVAGRLLVQKLAQQMQVTPDKAKVDAFANYLIHTSPDPEKTKANYEQNENLRAFVEYFVLEDQVAEAILEKGIVEKT